MHGCTYSYPSPSISLPTPCMAVHNSSRAFLKVPNSPIHAHILYPTSPMNPPPPFLTPCAHETHCPFPHCHPPCPSTYPSCISIALIPIHCSHTHLHFLLERHQTHSLSLFGAYSPPCMSPPFSLYTTFFMPTSYPHA